MAAAAVRKDCSSVPAAEQGFRRSQEDNTAVVWREQVGSWVACEIAAAAAAV